MAACWKIMVPLLAAFLAVASAGLAGGPMDADINEKGVKDALQFAVVQHNKASNDLFVSQVHKVMKVQKQVVAGLKYIFTVQMARTSCRKGGAEKLCSVQEDAVPYECTFEVWSRPWLSDIQVVRNTCNK
ncbi:hypothetical protein MATL_G00189590 [Megalops atlanticus]|uniref:Cystatin domain-containing protein n=1 Tax=Megalops atlanticus TaxID=7932 RepID=A0A9D3T1P3_MEGAT|nr:hypothetical protein MATL_G00189590 [Megalops atlanticus]